MSTWACTWQWTSWRVQEGVLVSATSKLTWIDKSKDDEVVLPRVCKVFHTISYGSNGLSLAGLWVEIAILWTKSVQFGSFMDDNVSFMDENDSLLVKFSFMDKKC
jgi:hypothetical protein